MADYCYPYSKFTDYFIESNGIDTSISRDIEVIDARELISPRRFDLMAKWIYIDAYEKGLDMTYALETYRDNINAFSSGACSELGSDSKTSFEGYVKEFNELIESIKSNGFNEQKSIIPVGSNNAICDGAHRVTIAAYYNMKVSIVRFPELSRNYNYSYFRRYLMCDINMERMANEYARLFPQSCKMMIWHTTNYKMVRRIRSYLNNCLNVVYEQDVFVNRQDILSLENIIDCANWLSMRTKKHLKKGCVIHTALLQIDQAGLSSAEELFQKECRRGSDMYYETNSETSLHELINLLHNIYNTNRICVKASHGNERNTRIPVKYRQERIIAKNSKLLKHKMYGYGDDPYWVNWIRISTKWLYIKKALSYLKRRVKKVLNM